MYKNKRFLAIIAARGGSRRLPIRECLHIGRISDYEQANNEYHGVFK